MNRTLARGKDSLWYQKGILLSFRLIQMLIEYSLDPVQINHEALRMTGILIVTVLAEKILKTLHGYAFT